MSQWAKGKRKQPRGPPPALFVHGSPAASSASLAGGGGGDGGDGGVGTGAAAAAAAAAAGSSGPGASTGPAGPGAATGMPSLPTLQRTASRLPEAADGSAAAASSAKRPAPTTTAGTTMTTATAAGTATATTTTAGAGAGAMAATAASAAATGTAPGTGGGPTTAFSLPLTLPQAAAAAAAAAATTGSSTRATDRTDALWAEMQATLEEVELSASEGTRVFGADHGAKLAALRQAQIALAQAWARSEVGADGGGQEGEPDDGGGGGGAGAAATTAGTSVSGGGGGGGGGVDASATRSARDREPERFGARPQRLEEETQVDILLARKRREANDRYFRRVNQGLLDVKAKLEDVARAMRAVEHESMDIWGENGGGAGGEPARAAT